MTCAEKFKLITSFNLLSSLDFVEGIMTTTVVLMMMICFFGKEGKITRKKLLPIIIFICFGIGLNMFSIVYDYFVLRGTWNEPIQEGTFLLSEFVQRAQTGMLFKLLYYMSIAFTTARMFEKHKILNCIASIAVALIFSFYIMIVSAISIAYFSDDPRDAVGRIFDKAGIKGYDFALICITSIFFIILAFLLALYFGMIKKQRKMYIEWKYRILFSIWTVVMIVIHWMPFRKNFSHIDHERYMGYELALVIPIMGLLIPIIIIILISRRYAIEKTLVQENYISAELAYINQYKRDQNETRAFRHDIINNLSMLSAMYSDKNFDDAGDHLKTLLGNVQAMSPKYITGDEMLDCIVGIKSSKMEEDGIDFTVNGVIDGGLGMKPVDVCSIFANALDNAIEACDRISDESKKWIKLDIKRTEKFYSIVMSNTMATDKKSLIAARRFGEGDRVTTKKNSNLHGFGTQNMKATISKYDGIEKVNVEDGIFTLSIMIPKMA